MTLSAPLVHAALPVDGLWSATVDGLGGGLTLELTSKDVVVSGRGRYTVGAHRQGGLSVSGTYRPPALTLALAYDHGEIITLSAKVVDHERMIGKLVWTSGTELDVIFVRP